MRQFCTLFITLFLFMPLAVASVSHKPAAHSSLEDVQVSPVLALDISGWKGLGGRDGVDYSYSKAFDGQDGMDGMNGGTGADGRDGGDGRHGTDGEDAGEMKVWLKVQSFKEGYPVVDLKAELLSSRDPRPDRYEFKDLYLTPEAPLALTAIGGFGGDGGDGGSGEQGGDGGDGGDATRFRPNAGDGGNGGRGGDSGRGGNGGDGGHGGMITIFYPEDHPELKEYVVGDISGGRGGRAGENGVPGPGGRGGRPGERCYRDRDFNRECGAPGFRGMSGLSGSRAIGQGQNGRYGRAGEVHWVAQ